MSHCLRSGSDRTWLNDSGSPLLVESHSCSYQKCNTAKKSLHYFWASAILERRQSLCMLICRSMSIPGGGG